MYLCVSVSMCMCMCVCICTYKFHTLGDPHHQDPWEEHSIIRRKCSSKKVAKGWFTCCNMFVQKDAESFLTDMERRDVECCWVRCHGCFFVCGTVPSVLGPPKEKHNCPKNTFVAARSNTRGPLKLFLGSLTSQHIPEERYFVVPPKLFTKHHKTIPSTQVPLE